MTGELARRYAAALYDLMPDGEGAVAEMVRDLTASAPLWSALCAPDIAPREKRGVLQRLGTPGPMQGLLLLLADRGRMSLLPQIGTAYADLALERRGGCRCVLRCCNVPDQGRQKQIKDTVCRLHQKREVALEIVIDPSLLGGFILEAEGMTYDRSVRGRLAELGRTLQGS